MKKMITAMSVLCIVSLAQTVGATLVDYGNGVLFDDTNHQYWYQDLPALTNMSYEEQITFIEDISISTTSHMGDIYTFSSWAMASHEDQSALLETYSLGDVSEAFTSSYTMFIDGHWAVYWGGRIDAFELDPVMWGYYILQRGEGAPLEGSNLEIFPTERRLSVGAWVVTAGPTASPIPEPTTLLLFGTGLASLAGFRFRKKKK